MLALEIPPYLQLFDLLTIPEFTQGVTQSQTSCLFQMRGVILCYVST